MKSFMIFCKRLLTAWMEMNIIYKMYKWFWDDWSKHKKSWKTHSCTLQHKKSLLFCLPPPASPPLLSGLGLWESRRSSWLCRQLSAPFRWGPPGDSSTASDWGCATVPDSSTNNAEKRMLMDQIRWVQRWEEGARRKRGGRWQALQISCHSDEALRARYGVFVVCVWVRSTGRPGLRPQLLTCFTSMEPWSREMKEEC